MQTRYTFRVPAEITVVVDGEDTDETYELAVKRVESALNSLPSGFGTDRVRVEVSIDGVGADEAEAVED